MTASLPRTLVVAGSIFLASLLFGVACAQDQGPTLGCRFAFHRLIQTRGSLGYQCGELGCFEVLAPYV